eukprot:c926_g1_i1 orf=393-1157(-)
MARLSVIVVLLGLCIAVSFAELVTGRKASRQLGYSSGSTPSTSSPATKPAPPYDSSPSYGSSPSSNPSSGSSPTFGGSPSSNPPSSSSPIVNTPTTPVTSSPSTPSPTTGSPVTSSPSTPSPTTGSPVTSSPSTPSTSSPKGKTGKGTCKFWRSQSRNWPKVLSRVTKLARVFGRSCASRYGSKLTLMDALQTTDNDGFSALAREGAASLLNAYSVAGFEFTPTQVKEQFDAATSTPQEAAAQATKFEQANESV